MARRIQLTLFVDPLDSLAIEVVRRKYNPVQYEIIQSHVTLCREDDLVDLDAVMRNLAMLPRDPVVIRFGRPVRFDEGKGVLLPAIEDEDFRRLRGKVLAGVVGSARRPEAHITLMHPRNSTCTDELFDVISSMAFPVELMFREVSLIEQGMKEEPWRVLKRFIF